MTHEEENKILRDRLQHIANQDKWSTGSCYLAQEALDQEHHLFQPNQVVLHG